MSQHRILLADDSSTMHRAVKLALSRADFEIICCDNGTDALRICRESLPSLLIADLDLPGISGAELVKQVKQEASLTQTKIILLCSSVHQSDIGRLDRIAADARLWKPFESEALFTLVQTLLRSAQGPRSNTLMSSASTQQINRSSFEKSPVDNDATRPIQKASTLVERTMPAADPTIGTSPTRLQPFEGEATRPLSTKDATQNLWSSDFELPTSTPVSPTSSQSAPTSLREETYTPPVQQQQQSRTHNESLSVYREAQSEWEVLGKNRSASPTPPLPPASNVAPVSGSAGPTYTREEMRNIVRAEIQMAFETWFKEKLESKLLEILSQIDSETKKIP